jgi:Zn-dependent protease with chaperone function
MIPRLSKSCVVRSVRILARSGNGVRFVRALWPAIFLIPLSWWADRGCRLAGVDPLYHGTMWIHERLGWFIALLALVSASVVAVKIIVARVRFGRLLSLAEPLPPRLSATLEKASADLGIAIPRIVYLDVAAPIATTVFGSVVLLSRGFTAPLDDNELELVVRHEFVHAGRGDATAGVLWHLAFAALLIPGFEPLERRLHAARERYANVRAAEGSEARYLALFGRVAHGASLCAGVRLGMEARDFRGDERWLVWLGPFAVAVLAVALTLSHLAFRHDLPYLITHHC